MTDRQTVSTDDYAKLKAELEQRWISVEDRLPAGGNWYIINSNCNSPFQPNVVTMAFLDHGDDGFVWLVHNDESRNYSERGEWEGVTHWMPLPIPRE